jgi:Integrase core domain
MGIRDRPTLPHCQWQNGYAERLIGSIRLECLDHVVVFGERHLRHVLLSYMKYHKEIRTHLSLEKDAPVSRAVKTAGTFHCRPVLRAASPICLDLIYDRHSRRDGMLEDRDRQTFRSPTLRRSAQPLDRRTGFRLDQPQSSSDARFRALHQDRRSLRSPRYDPHHAQTPHTFNPMLQKLVSRLDRVRGRQGHRSRGFSVARDSPAARRVR